MLRVGQRVINVHTNEHGRVSATGLTTAFVALDSGHLVAGVFSAFRPEVWTDFLTHTELTVLGHELEDARTNGWIHGVYDSDVYNELRGVEEDIRIALAHWHVI